VIELLLKAFRHLAKSWETQDQKLARGVNRRESRAPVSPGPGRGSRQRCLGQDFRLSRKRSRPERRTRTAKMRQQTPCNPHFQRPAPDIRGTTGLVEFPRLPDGWRAFTARTRFGLQPRRTVRRSLPISVQRVRGLWHLVTGRPARCPPCRREPRRATSLDRFYSRRVKRPELPRSKIPSIVREPEGPLRPRRLSPRDRSQRRFTRRGLRHFGL